MQGLTSSVLVGINPLSALIHDNLDIYQWTCHEHYIWIKSVFILKTLDSLERIKGAECYCGIELYLAI